MNDQDFNAIIKSELNRRMTENQRYSLRGFARALKMDPSTLSKILSGQRKISEKAQSKMLIKLGINTNEISDLFSSISDEDFEQIPEWYDTAILEQLMVSGFKATKKTLSQVFELNEIQVASALLRLQKLKLIKISKAGVVSDATSGQTTNFKSPTTTHTKRNLQKQFLEKAISSIDIDPIEERDMTTITCAIDSDKVAEAKLRIKKFRREMAEFLTSGSKSNRTYNLTISLYPLSKNFKKETK